MKPSSILHTRLENAPLFSGVIGKWRGLILANTTARREAKAVLFAELAEAARQGMPLDQALARSAQTLRESAGTTAPETAPGASNQNGLLNLLIAAATWIFLQHALVAYLLITFRLVDAGRIARGLALRLHEQVRKGIPLSQAMRQCGLDYDPSEIRIVAAAESCGSLPVGLKHLSQFQVTETRLTMQGAQILYPLILAGIMSLVGAFILTFIMPKFKDIYQQLGAELPLPTQLFVDLGYVAAQGPGLLFLQPVILVAAYCVVRGLMNGNWISKYILVILPALLLGGLMWAIGSLLSHSGLLPSGPVPDPNDILLLAGAALLIYGTAMALLAPPILASLEQLILSIEQKVGPLLRHLPVVGAAARADAESRWLGGLATALSCGVAAPDAVRLAGSVSGGRFLRRSASAAELVAAGHTIGDACRRHAVLQPRTCDRLVLIEAYDDYVVGLHGIADDAAQDAFEVLNRTGRAVGVLSVLLLGIFTGMFAIAMYLPLFNIVKIVGNE